MTQKPELIAFSENKLGGVQSYYHNLLSNDTANQFDKRWIFTDKTDPEYVKLINPYNVCDEVVFPYGERPLHKYAYALNKLISDKPGVVMVNQELELIALHRYPVKNKTIIHVSHDENYLPLAIKYAFLIDVFVAHNPYLFDELIKRLPAERKSDIYYLPYGVELSPFVRSSNLSEKLKIVFIARLHKLKGVYDFSKIDDCLIEKNVHAEWSIIGDGPEKSALVESLTDRRNFSFFTPETTAGVYEIASKNDLFILPSYLDGMPVALLEAMSAGLVPLVYRFNQGIDTVVTPEIGYVVPMGDFNSLAQNIMLLDNNRSKLESMSANSLTKATNEFEAKTRAKEYYALFEKFKQLKKPLRRKHIKYDGKLDYPFIPQFMRDIIHAITRYLASEKSARKS